MPRAGATPCRRDVEADEGFIEQRHARLRFE